MEVLLAKRRVSIEATEVIPTAFLKDHSLSEFYNIKEHQATLIECCH
jgi:hypothetical protein